MEGFDTYINAPTGRLDLLGHGVSLSTGNSLQVESKFTHDGTGQSKSITRRIRNAAMTGSLRWTVGHVDCVEAGTNIFDYLGHVEELCGQKVTIIFNGVSYKDMLITDTGVSLTIDAVDIISAASLSLSFTESYTPKSKTPYTATTPVNTL